MTELSKTMRVLLILIIGMWGYAWVVHSWSDAHVTNFIFMGLLTTIVWFWISYLIWKAEFRQ